jgi:hypothetical protein
MQDPQLAALLRANPCQRRIAIVGHCATFVQPLRFPAFDSCEEAQMELEDDRLLTLEINRVVAGGDPHAGMLP